MEAYFKQFGLDIGHLCLNLGYASWQDILSECKWPECTEELQASHIKLLMAKLDETKYSREYSILQSMITPRELLNPNSVLLQRIWRFTGYCNRDIENSTVIRHTLQLGLKEFKDHLNIDENGKAIPEPKVTPRGFRGLSCFLELPFHDLIVLHFLDLTTYHLMTYTERSSLISSIRQRHNILSVRMIIGVYIDAGENVPSNQWTVDLDDYETDDIGHVTLSVSNMNGLKVQENASAGLLSTLSELPWKCSSQCYVIRGEIDWDPSLFPVSNVEEWTNWIVAYGHLNNYFSVWMIYDRLYRLHVPFDKDLIKQIYDVVKSYYNSNEVDIHSQLTFLGRTLDFLFDIISA